MGAFVTADPTTRIITITKVPVSGLSSLDVQIDIYSDLKEDWQTDMALQRLRFPFRSFGDPKTPDQAIGPYVFLKNDEGWRMQPFDADHELTVNGNIVPEDTTLPIWLSRAGRSILVLEEQSAQAITTVAELLDIQHNSFNDGVTLDVVDGVAGITYPTGTPRQPSNNLTDCKLIATERGFTNLYLVSDVNFVSGDSLSGFTIVGHSIEHTTVDVAAAAVFDTCEFDSMTLTGVLDSDCIAVRSLVDGVDFASGSQIIDCQLMGTITITGAKQVNIIRPSSAVAGAGTPIIDMDGDGPALSIRGLNGGITLKNKTGAAAVSIDVASGQIILESTVTDGVIVCRGVGKLIDNSTGTADVRDEMVSGLRQILMEKILRNEFHTDPATGLSTIFDDDGVTPFLRFTLYEDIAKLQPYRGQGADVRERMI